VYNCETDINENKNTSVKERIPVYSGDQGNWRQFVRSRMYYI